MNIVTPKECRAAKRVVMKALSAINARERELHWTAELQNLESKYRPLTISARIDAAKAKTLEELSEFRRLKAELEFEQDGTFAAWSVVVTVPGCES